MFKLRFWWVVFKAMVSKRNIGPSYLHFWVSPFECDINFHCNNASYLKYMDLGRWDLLLRMRLTHILFKSKIYPVAVNVNINFHKALPPGAFFTLETTFEELGEKTFKMKQVFRRHGRIVAEALVTAVFVHKGRAVHSSRFTDLLPPDLKARLSEFQ